LNERALTWTAYLFMACQGYLLYAIGFMTPYLQDSLGVPPWVAALPNSMMALGILSAGLYATRIPGLLGPRRAARLFAALMAISCILLANPITILPILLGAFLLGVAITGMLVHVVSALGGREGGKHLARAYLWAMVAAVAAPLVLSVSSHTIGWAVGPLAPVPVLLVLVLTLPASPVLEVSTASREIEPGLPRAYWLMWTFLVLCMGAEFSIVAWGAQVASSRSSIDPADATALASLYVVGMILGRLGLSSGVASGPAKFVLLRGSAGLALVGSVIVWIAVTPLLAAVGFLLAGLGMAGIMPMGSTLALALAPMAPIRASARLTAAMGVAVLSAPLVVGLAAGTAGVVGAWLLELALLGGAILVLANVAPPAGRQLPSVSLAKPRT
jgi:MFS family permease